MPPSFLEQCGGEEGREIAEELLKCEISGKTISVSPAVAVTLLVPLSSMVLFSSLSSTALSESVSAVPLLVRQLKPLTNYVLSPILVECNHGYGV